MIGDGSGFSWNIGIGWANVVIDRHSMGRKLLWGGWSSGNIGIAELMPYVHGLAWYEYNHGPARRKDLRKPVLKIHVICDNETVVLQGNHTIDRKKLLPWWGCWAKYLSNGYTAKFYHTMGHKKNAQLGLNVLCDHVSRQARLLMEGMTLASIIPQTPNLTPYDINPL